MARTSEQWQALSPSYRARLERRGITQQLYTSGASLAPARGHQYTPEKPYRAQANPVKYARYIARKAKPLPKIITLSPDELRMAAIDHITSLVNRAHATGAVKAFGDNGENNEGKVDLSGNFIADHIRNASEVDPEHKIRSATEEEMELLHLLSYDELAMRAREQAIRKNEGLTHTIAFFYHAG